MATSQLKPRHSPAQIARLLSYDPLTGELTWKTDVGNRGLAGRVAGYFDGRYRRVQIEGNAYLAHRLAWCLRVGDWPEEFIDHADGDKTNNKWLNLRSASAGDNQANRRNLRSNTSGVKGVSWHKGHEKWYARVAHKGKSYFLGLFTNLVDAAAAVSSKRENLHKEFANHG
jgi:hypothetical protein